MCFESTKTKQNTKIKKKEKKKNTNQKIAIMKVGFSMPDTFNLFIIC